VLANPKSYQKEGVNGNKKSCPNNMDSFSNILKKNVYFFFFKFLISFSNLLMMFLASDLSFFNSFSASLRAFLATFFASFSTTSNSLLKALPMFLALSFKLSLVASVSQAT
jgi:hypothetical protein